MVQLAAARLSESWQQALPNLISLSLKLVWCIFVLWLGVGQYHPLKLGLFPLSLKDRRRWLAPLIALCALVLHSCLRGALIMHLFPQRCSSMRWNLGLRLIL